jgi:hypothetical protein
VGGPARAAALLASNHCLSECRDRRHRVARRRADSPTPAGQPQDGGGPRSCGTSAAEPPPSSP